ncbi:MAG: hypothetical protein ACYTBJ_17920 [Planctomycetota bacterium]
MCASLASLTTKPTLCFDYSGYKEWVLPVGTGSVRNDRTEVGGLVIGKEEGEGDD